MLMLLLLAAVKLKACRLCNENESNARIRMCSGLLFGGGDYEIFTSGKDRHRKCNK